MMKLLFLLVITGVVLMPSTHAEQKTIGHLNELVRQVGTPPCAACEANKGSKSSGRYKIPMTPRSKNDATYFNKDCTKFIKEDGTYGVWGEEIETYINKKGREDSRFLGDHIPGMSSAPFTCPNWKKLSADDRINFWVWMIASMAMVESTCNVKALNVGSAIPDRTDPPRGLMQLNSLKSGRSWRGPNCKFANNGMGAIDQIRCSMDIMEQVLKGKTGHYKSNGMIFPTNSYWEKLRPRHSSNGGPIGKLARRFPPCGAKE